MISSAHVNMPYVRLEEQEAKMVRRVAFLSGLALGSAVCAWVLGSALTYLFTGKVPSIQVGGEKPVTVELVDLRALYKAPMLVSSPAATPDREEF
jgi:hypothetical protein